MSALIITLPSAASQASTTYEYVLSPDGQSATDHASAPPALLPLPGRGGEIVAVVPARMLSWHGIDLPQGVGPGAPRLRGILQGLLEEQLLDEPEQLHFALSPGVTPGGRACVAICDHAWLQGHLQALEAAQRPVTRIVPELAPSDGPSLAYAVEGGDQPWLLVTGRACGGVMALPLTQATLALLPRDDAAPLQLVAEPGVAALAEQILQHPVPLQQRSTRALLAAQSPWDLAQFDLTSSGRARTMKRLTTLLREGWHAPAWRPARWGIGALVAAHLIGLNAWAWQERTSWQTRRAAIDDALTQTFPHVRVVVDAPLQMSREVAALRQATGTNSSRDLEAMLSAVASAAPAGWAVDAIEFSAGEARLKGPPLDAPATARLINQLQPLGYAARQDGAHLVVQAEQPR